MIQQEQSPQPERGRGDPSIVQVFANKDASGQWQFHMHQDNQPVTELEFDKTRKQLKKSDWHDVTFVLEEPTGSLQFHPRKEQAIWVARGSPTEKPGCPSGPSSDPLKGFRAQSDPKPRELTVHNANKEPCYLSYRLNFVAAGSRDDTIVAFHDPVVGNKNGGIDD